MTIMWYPRGKIHGAGAQGVVGAPALGQVMILFCETPQRWLLCQINIFLILLNFCSMKEITSGGISISDIFSFNFALS